LISHLFSVSFQFLVGFCFLKPRVCWLLFSSSFVDLGICFNYCLDLMLGCCPALPRTAPPSSPPADPPSPWNACPPTGFGEPALPPWPAPLERLPTQRGCSVGPPLDGPTELSPSQPPHTPVSESVGPLSGAAH
jgi:hypothetical protein